MTEQSTPARLTLQAATARHAIASDNARRLMQQARDAAETARIAAEQVALAAAEVARVEGVGA